MADKIVVIGGGISGLSCAYRLMKAGADVVLLEKESCGGGVIRTGKKDGYLFECGPNSTMNSNDEIDSLCKELGIDGDRVFGNESSKKRYVIRNGRPIPLPMGLKSLLTTDLWSLGGKLRLLKEPFVSRYRSDGEESVADFVARRIGRELLDYALDPFVSGVYAGDPEKLELKSTFPKMDALEREHGSLILGAIKNALKGGNKSERRKGIFSFKDGMSTLPDAITKALGDRFRGGSDVTAIEKHEDKYLVHLKGGETVEADKLVLSAPSHVGAKMISKLAPEAAKELKNIEYAPIAVVYAGFNSSDVAHPLDGFGCLIPKKEGCKLLGSLWSSTLFPGRAPEGKVSLSCFIGGARNRGIVNQSDDEVLAEVLADLKTLLGVDGSPVFTNIVRYDRSIPQYTLGHSARMANIERALQPFPGLHLLGNYLKGISVADCVKNGTQMANCLLSD
ncbi:MAG: protoporphyrinogen oxidase [Proteobacteria bacterium]|nr:protoporphyrinogen oxidase [Pseudomonadota bacterium]